MTSQPLDSVAPQARFTARALAHGLTMADVGDLLHLGRGSVVKHLRIAARACAGATCGVDVPPPSAADHEILAAVDFVLEDAAEPPGRAPGTRCPDEDVLRFLARGEMDGPLLLATAEHVADCPACLSFVVAARKDGSAPEAAEAESGRSPVPVILGALAGAALVIAYYVLR